MCEFNTGCPGWTDGYEDGFIPCSEDLGCATSYARSLNDLHKYPIESKGRYDRYATGPEDSEWVCGDCGMVCDPDTHHEECHVTYSSIERYVEDGLFQRVMSLLKIYPVGEFA